MIDSVICAFGRLGTWFGVERWPEVRPDMITFAKGVTSGYLPLGGVIVDGAIAAPFFDAPGSPMLRHGATYAGHPTCCAAALAVLDAYEAEDLIPRGRELEEPLRDALAPLADHPAVGEVRARHRPARRRRAVRRRAGRRPGRGRQARRGRARGGRARPAAAARRRRLAAADRRRVPPGRPRRRRSAPASTGSAPRRRSAGRAQRRLTRTGRAGRLLRGVDAHAVDPDDAARLWTVSAGLTGVDAFAPV